MDKPKRDGHNQLDHVDADRILHDTAKRLISESSALNKDRAFNNARSGKRDIIVKIIVYRRNTFNGMVVLGDKQSPEYENLSGDPLDPHRFKYVDHIDGEIYVKNQPMGMGSIGKWLMGNFNALTRCLYQMGVIENVKSR